MLTFIEKLIFSEKELMFHEYDAFSWYGLIIIRAIIFIYFVVSVKDELLMDNRKENIRKFAKIILIVGVWSYFLLPFAFISSYFFNYYQRFKLIAYLEIIE